jgi:NADPH2 dehydrogenase
MYSCKNKDGQVTNWHKTHYTSRAVGQVGLIIVEASAVTPQGRISNQDLGIWDDSQVKGLRELVDMVHEHGAKIGIQLAHAGRKAQIDGPIIAPSAIAFNAEMKTPNEMSTQQIKDTIAAFVSGAMRAKQAGFDLIEIHAAHGYLINEFLSPLSNLRTDEYGGTREQRFLFLEQIINAIKSEWDKPLFVRISANEYAEGGNHWDDFLYYAQRMKALGVDLIDCSSGGVVPAAVDVYPGYQITYAQKIRESVGIATGAVGMITKPAHAEEIIRNGRADLVLLARELLRDPYWPRTAAKELGVKLDAPQQYTRAW